MNRYTSIDPASQSFDAEALDKFCKAIERIRESGLSIEQTAAALLPRTQLATLGQERLIKTSEQIETLLKSLQQRLRSVVAIQPNVTLESQTAEALSTIFDAATAAKVVEAIRSAGDKEAADRTPDAALITILCGDAGATHSLGDWSPLLSVALATEILTVSATNKADTDTRFSLLLEGVAQRRELVAAIAEQCGLTESDVIPLLGDRLLLDPAPGQSTNASEVLLDASFWAGDTPPSMTAAAFPRLHNWMDRLYRLVTLSAALGLDSELMRLADRVAVGNRTGVDWRDILATTTAAVGVDWRALLDLMWLQRPEQLSRATLRELFDKLEALGAQPVLPETLRYLATRLGMNEGQTLAIAAQATSVAAARNLCDPSQLRRAFELLLLARHLGADAVQLQQLANLDDYAHAAPTAKKLLQARVGEQAWPAVLQKIDDQLRQQRRDALVAYLTHGYDFRDVNHLYEHFLIDPQVEPCLETTYILEAITATQLFAQRILFGLEPGISASEELKQRWTWMRNYRVWEANRKVFLFPENWLYPELRDDKSSSFKQLESALGQGELNQDLARQSFGQFLDDVAQMGQVQVLGMYEHLERDMSRSEQPIIRRDLYVVGRTINLPYLYYWRRCIDFGSRWMEWSPWQRIELDIQGDHVLPFVINGDFHLAWSTQKKGDAKGASGEAWVVRLSWSRYDGAHWHEPNLSREVVHFADSPFRDDRSGFYFRLWNDPGSPKSSVLITCYVAHTTLHSTAPQEESLTEEKSLGFPASRPTQSKLYFVQNDGAISILPGDSGWPPPDVTTDYSASRTLTWSCWIKVKAGSGTGWIELSPSSIHPRFSIRPELRHLLMHENRGKNDRQVEFL